MVLPSCNSRLRVIALFCDLIVDILLLMCVCARLTVMKLLTAVTAAFIHTDALFAHLVCSVQLHR